MFFGDLPRTKKNPTWVFFAFFSEENSPELRTDLGTWGNWFKVFHVSVEKAWSGNQNLGTPSCKWKKWSNIWFHQTKAIQKLEWQKIMRSQTSQSCFKWGNHSLVCFLDGKSSSKGTGTHLLWSSSGYSERSSVATCQLSSWWDDLRIPTEVSKLGHLFRSITWYFSFMWPFSNYYKILLDVMFYVGKNSSIRC